MKTNSCESLFRVMEGNLSEYVTIALFLPLVFWEESDMKKKNTKEIKLVYCMQAVALSQNEIISKDVQEYICGSRLEI